MGTATLPIGRHVSLQDRYLLREATVLLTAIQALVRLGFEQLGSDHRARQTSCI